jgi:hypothetical protein
MSNAERRVVGPALQESADDGEGSFAGNNSRIEDGHECIRGNINLGGRVGRIVEMTCE